MIKQSLSTIKKIQILAFLPLSFASLLGPEEPPIIAQKEISLENRYDESFVNGVFKDNILLNLAYLRGSVSSKESINWDEVKKPFIYEFSLEPNQTFAYHDDVLPQYKDTLVKHTSAHFNAQEGFRTDGYLFGDGVCHLASLIYWAAKEANLYAEAPTNHNFMNIPDIPKEYGVSIYSNPYSKDSNSRQNLYITNNKAKPITFKFEYDGKKVKVSVLELN
ncbi:VanW family protein [Candidatus Daviesbacteria bacterium]|nr:VanW family protein [Candidatus Daviesbacteria bacterium]